MYDWLKTPVSIDIPMYFTLGMSFGQDCFAEQTVTEKLEQWCRYKYFPDSQVTANLFFIKFSYFIKNVYFIV